MKSSEIKKYFKNLGIPVRFCTVAVKHPFAQIWIESEKQVSHLSPLKYSHEFPLAMRVKLLKIHYGESFECANGNAGNVNPHSMVFSETEWNKLIESEISQKQINNLICGPKDASHSH